MASRIAANRSTRSSHRLVTVETQRAVARNSRGLTGVVERQRRSLETILASHVGSSAQQVRLDTDRDLTLTAAEAVDYGLIDSILSPGT